MNQFFLAMAKRCPDPSLRAACLTAFSLYFLCTTTVFAGEVVDIKTRDTTIRVLIEGPSNPPAVIAIFHGGDGAVEISDQGEIGKGRSNFAVTTRRRFQEKGYATAVVAAPTDMGARLTSQRGSDEYAADFGNVMQYLRERFKAPVWVHGTSRGTISIALPVPKIKEPIKRPDGIIFSSSVTLSNSRSKHAFDNVLMGDLEKITVPVLVVAHEKDTCRVTPPSGAKQIADALKNAKPVKVKIFDAPDEVAKGDECGPTGHHGYPSIRGQVINAMIEFISHQK